MATILEQCKQLPCRNRSSQFFIVDGNISYPNTARLESLWLGTQARNLSTIYRCQEVITELSKSRHRFYEPGDLRKLNARCFLCSNKNFLLIIFHLNNFSVLQYVVLAMLKQILAFFVASANIHFSIHCVLENLWLHT